LNLQHLCLLLEVTLLIEVPECAAAQIVPAPGAPDAVRHRNHSVARGARSRNADAYTFIAIQQLIKVNAAAGGIRCDPRSLKSPLAIETV
jgi:hypothetical protein